MTPANDNTKTAAFAELEKNTVLFAWASETFPEIVHVLKTCHGMIPDARERVANNISWFVDFEWRYRAYESEQKRNGMKVVQ